MSLHVDGFDQFQGDTSLPSAMSRGGYSLSGSAVVLSVGRNGTRGIGCSLGEFSRPHPWLSNNLSIGCAAQFTGSRGSIMWVDFGNDERLVLWMDPEDGAPRLNDDKGGSLPVMDTWYYYDITINRTSRQAQLYINDVVDTVTEITPTMAEAEEVVVHFGRLASNLYGNPDPDRGTKIYDDIYLRDGARFGPIVVTTRQPTMTEIADWTAVGGPSNAQILASRPPNLLGRYTLSNDPGSKDEFRSMQGLLSQNDVLATGLVVLARKPESLPVRLRGHIGGTDPNAPTLRTKTVEVPPEWQLQYLIFDQVGGDTVENITPARFGVEVV